MAGHIRTAVWLVLFILGVVLSAAQLGGKHDHASGTGHGGHDHAQHQPLRLFEWEPERAHTLILRVQDGRNQVYVRVGQAWQSSRSAPDVGNRASLDPQDNNFDPGEYVSLLSQARRDREFAADADSLTSFGLAPALLHIRIEDREGAVLADLNVGSLTPDGFGRYVRMPSNTNVLIVPNYQFEKAIATLVE